MRKPPPAGSPFWRAANVVTRANVALFRATGGRVASRMPGTKARVLILHHVGRKSGTPRTTPLLYLDDEPNVVVVASKGGTDTHPAWFHNVMAMDTTEVELPGVGRRSVKPRVAEGDERERLWRELVGIYQPYAAYQTFTPRQIPVVVLEPAQT
jgi:deazaflavin-dependent oxidoreductase (nitroreductase family)